LTTVPLILPGGESEDEVMAETAEVRVSGLRSAMCTCAPREHSK
jgi:hypothetical protein